jgi:hypothetical protein
MRRSERIHGGGVDEIQEMRRWKRKRRNGDEKRGEDGWTVVGIDIQACLHCPQGLCLPLPSAMQSQLSRDLPLQPSSTVCLRSKQNKDSTSHHATSHHKMKKVSLVSTRLIGSIQYSKKERITA